MKDLLIALSVFMLLLSSDGNAAIYTDLEFTGTLDLNDNSYMVEFNIFGNFVVSPMGSFDGRFPIPGTTGRVEGLSLKNPGPDPVEGFLRFDSTTFARFDLEALLPGVYGSSSCFDNTAISQVCTPAGTGMNFTNLSGGSTLSFAVTGQMVDMADMSTTPYSGLFVAIHPSPYQSYLNDNGFTGWTYSAIFQPTGSPTMPVIPIPGAVWLFSSAIGLLGWLQRRSKIQRLTLRSSGTVAIAPAP